MPVDIYNLQPPRVYYEVFRPEYERRNLKNIPELLKGSYVTELEETLDFNISVFRRKSSFYYNALLYALISIIPYLICLGFHISKKQEEIHKVEIVDTNDKN